MSPDSQERRLLHVTGSRSAAEVIRKTLRRLGRKESVIGMRDGYTEGPLHDVDAGGACRIEWWSRLNGKPLSPEEVKQYDDSDLWAEVRASARNVLVWHGPIAVERLLALRACWQLRNQAARVYEVAVPISGRQWRGIERPVFYDAVAIAKPAEMLAAWNLRAKVTDVAERAARWEEIRSMPGECIRVLEGEDLVHLPVTAFDAELVKECRGDWRKSMLVVGHVLARHPVTDSLLYWRVRELLHAGCLEGRGAANRVGLPEEVRPSEGNLG